MTSTPIRQVKPKFIPAQFFVWGPLLAAFVSIFPGFFAFVISNLIHGFTNTNPFNGGQGPITEIGLTVYFVSFVICIVLHWIQLSQAPSRTTYTIFQDRIEYDEGLWNRHQRTQLFDQVIDVELAEGVLQQTQGAGTVTLVTQQLISAGEGRLSNRRITLRNVPQPKDIYDLVRSLAMQTNTR